MHPGGKVRVYGLLRRILRPVQGCMNKLRLIRTDRKARSEEKEKEKEEKRRA